jgi:hypothetical protein
MVIFSRSLSIFFTLKIQFSLGQIHPFASKKSKRSYKGLAEQRSASVFEFRSCLVYSDDEWPAKKIDPAGKVLANVRSIPVVDKFPVVAEYLSPAEERQKMKKLLDGALFHHC